MSAPSSNVSTRTPRDRPAAVVIGLDSMQGIQTARILRRHGIPIFAVASDPRHPCCRTNACEEIRFVDTGSAELVDTLRELGGELGHRPVLFPCQDKSVRVISKHRDALRDLFHFVLPPVEVVEMLMDKNAFHAHAVATGLPVPVAFVLNNRDDAEAAAAAMPFPCILKPAFRSGVWNSKTGEKLFRVQSADELLARYDACRDWSEALIAQQWVDGDDGQLFSCNCYYGADGEPLVTFVARKLRQWPPEAGSSCLGEEVRDDTVLRTALALFGGVPYRGLGYVEMKKDARTGEYFIIEPNIGRPTGRSAIAEAGGVALLYTMYCDALGLPLPANREQKFTGTKWIDLRHDLQSAFSYWRRGQLSLRQWWGSWRGRKAHAIFSWRDPKPFLCDLWRATGQAVSGRSRRRVRGEASEV